jgi:ABC-2 type transport system permease protein
MKPLRHTWQVTLRYLRALFRQPAWIGITLVQPLIWLLLFGALFKSIARIPGFDGRSYVEFLTPGLIVMLAISSAGWSGMAYIEDMDLGVMDRFLVSPIWRGALNAGSVAQQVIIIALQSVIVAVLSLAVGGHFPNGVGGVAILIVVAALLGASFASLSNALALVVRQRESLIGAVTSVTLPLTFLSGAFMQQSLAPGWIQSVATYNPVNWAVEAGRSAATQQTDWSLVASRIGLLTGLLLVSAWLATRSFRAYQRSI